MTGTVRAMPTDEYVCWATYLSPHDGDSPHCRIFIPFEDDELFEGRIRLARINCPELSAPGGREATDFTTAWMQEALVQAPRRWTAWPLRMQGRIREKYGRPLVEVWRRSDGANLSDALLLAGHASTEVALEALPPPDAG